MFLFKVEIKVATNPKMNLGLFTKEFIPKNTKVWEFIEGVDIKMDEKTFNRLNYAQKEFFEKYGWKEDDGFYYSSCDLTNFINHNYNPNLEIVGDVIISNRDIQIGEELFEDYSQFDTEFDTYKNELI
jgi:SET domain-containing protein